MRYGIIIALLGAFWLGTAFLLPQQAKVQVCKRVSKTEFKSKLNSLKDVQLIDVRTPGEFQRGTIDGAINIDYTASNFTEMIGLLDKNKPTLIFCQSGGRSTAALKKFKSLGFDHVLELEGGYSAWKK